MIRRTGTWMAVIVTGAVMLVTGWPLAAATDSSPRDRVAKANRQAQTVIARQRLEELLLVPSHLEEPEDQLVGPRAARPRSPAAVVARNGFVSIQVNVDEFGNNIVGDAANEPSLAIDPTNLDKMAIGWRQFDTIESNFRQSGCAYSHDGGLSWNPVGVLEPGEFASDPVLAADGDGVFYYYSLQPERGPQPWQCYLYKSFDGGVTWPIETAAAGGDKAWLAIDTTHGPGRGNLYLKWSGYFGCCEPNDFIRSTSGGASFDSLQQAPLPANYGTVAVGPDGEVYIAGSLTSYPYIFVVKSTSAWNPVLPVSFSDWSIIDARGELLFGGGPNPDGLLGQVWVAVDHSDGPRRGHVYVLASLWPSDNSDPLDVVFFRSTDGGLTWSQPKRVNDDPEGNGAWQWFGTMSVAPNGRIDVIWNDTRNYPDSPYSELFYTWSADGGQSWVPSIPVSPAFDHSVGYPRQWKLGDYYEMISDEWGADVAYAATFNGEQDVYYVRLMPDCNQNGIVDHEDVAGGVSGDCNSNGLPDECEFAGDVDCNHNGTPDVCEPGGSEDCNANAVPDWCDIDTDQSDDCTTNGIPDECEPDCNSNGIADVCDIAAHQVDDCNGNEIPDECEVTRIVLLDEDFTSDMEGWMGTGLWRLSDSCSVGEPCDAPPWAYYGLDETCSFETGAATAGVLTAPPLELPAHRAMTLTYCSRYGGEGGAAPDSYDVAWVSANGTLIDDAGFENYSEQWEVRTVDLGAFAGETVTLRWHFDSQDELFNEYLGWQVDAVRVATAELGSGDCNSNGVPDDCDIAAGTSGDCNSNDVPDDCEPDEDCNSNGAADICDLADGTSADCNDNEVPDECELADNDCNTNGVPDECEDCNSNGLADECDLAAGTSSDCNSNEVPDDCEPDADCNTNGLQDICDLASGLSQDCNADLVPDECQPDEDCNENAIRDLCELGPGGAGDCDRNLVPDECQADCNANGVADPCDVSDGFSLDVNRNDIPDECERILHVSHGADRSADGLSWNGAFTELTEALAHAVTAEGVVQEIWVTSGVYTPAPPGGDAAASFDLVPGVAVYGGFAGHETLREQRDPAAAPTILSGDLNGNDDPSEAPDGASYDDNSLHVVRLTGAAAMATLDGVTIAGGVAIDGVDIYGAGINISEGWLLLRRCNVVGNYGGAGAGIFNGQGWLVLVDCRLLGNQAAENGGGVMNYQATFQATNTVFSGNQAAGLGAAVYSLLSPADFENCTLVGNEADSAGGGVYSIVDGPTLRNCALWGNVVAGVADEAAQVSGEVTSIDYSCVQGWAGTHGGQGNTGDDPMLAAPAGPDGIPGTLDDNPRLLPPSPGIDAGDPSGGPATTWTDLDGRPRVLCGVVDLGAYEFGAGDFDCDRRVSLDDFVGWPVCLTGPDRGPFSAGCEAFDLAVDGDVDLQDYARFQHLLPDASSGDLNGDGQVDADDYTLLLAAFGTCDGDTGYRVDADLDGDACVTAVDFQVWLIRYRAFLGDPTAPPPGG